MEPRPEEEGPPAPPPPPTPRRSHTVLYGVLLVAILIVGGAIHIARKLRFPPAETETVTVKATPALVTAVRDLARLETTQLHVEKVIDLRDQQSHLFGLVKTNDAMLLVAAVDVTIGVDLSKLRDEDIELDAATGAARICLPAPEILSTALDENGTYVYQHTTELLARRNETLEDRARKEAVRSVEETVTKGDVMTRARAQAEKELRALATQLGAKQVDFRCK